MREVLAKYLERKTYYITTKCGNFAEKQKPMSIKALYNRVKGFASRIASDKKQHLIAGFLICALFSLFSGYAVGLAVAVLAGAAKEVYDKVTKKGTPEVLDFAYTAIGAVGFIAFSVVLTLLLQAVITAAVA